MTPRLKVRKIASNEVVRAVSLRNPSLSALEAKVTELLLALDMSKYYVDDTDFDFLYENKTLEDLKGAIRE
jgi:hypothetical protein